MPGEGTASGSAKSEARLALAGVMLLGVIGCWLRVRGLDAYALSPDDALHVAEAALATPGELLAALAREDTHPPFHYLVLHVLIRLGAGDAALRAASLIPSLALIPLLYLLGCRISGRAAGLGAAFLATFSTPLILQAQVIRPYALELALLAAALCLVFDERPHESRRQLLGYGALMALAILTQYSAVIAVAAVGLAELSHLVRARRFAAALEWAALHVLLALLATLLLFGLASLLLDSDFRREAVDDWLAIGFPDGDYLVYWIERSLTQLVYFADPPRLLPGAILGVLLVTGSLALGRTAGARLVAMLLLASAINLVLAALALYPFSATRHALYLLPLLTPTAAAGLGWLWRRAATRMPMQLPLAVGIFAGLTVLACTHALEQEMRRGVVGIAELPLLREHYAATLAQIETTLPDEILVGDKQLAYYAWYEGSLRESERLSPLVGRTRLGSHDLYYFDPARALHTATDLARFLAELEQVVGDPIPPRLRFASLGWGNGLLFRLGVPGMADLNRQPGDRALQQALARARTASFSAGHLAGGGVVFSTTWKTLREGLPVGAVSPSTSSQQSEGAQGRD